MLLESIFADIKDEVETVTFDRLHAFIGAIKNALAEAPLIHDRFHRIQYLNNAINKVRRREVKSHPELKGSRFALLKNLRTRKQDEIFKVVQKANLQVSHAWQLREELKGIFECTSFAEAKAYFELWLTSVAEAVVKEVSKIAEMFQNYFDGGCNALWGHPTVQRQGRTNQWKNSRN